MLRKERSSDATLNHEQHIHFSIPARKIIFWGLCMWACNTMLRYGELAFISFRKTCV